MSSTTPFASVSTVSTTPLFGFGGGTSQTQAQVPTATSQTQSGGYLNLFNSQPTQTQAPGTTTTTSSPFSFSQQPFTTVTTQAGSALPRYCLIVSSLKTVTPNCLLVLCLWRFRLVLI